ncbi:MAG: hypothetical protein U0U67_14655 [Chitinophagales bacterium]
MGKRRNLNGLPGNIGLSYLSSLGYYNGGYMADWINYIARKEKVAELEIDILNRTITPKRVEIKPLFNDITKLQNIIESELNKNGFENSFITKAVMKFEIPIDSPNIKRKIYCYPVLEDVNGKIYKPKKRIIETAYETNFNPDYTNKTKMIFDAFIKTLKSMF